MTWTDDVWPALDALAAPVGLRRRAPPRVAGDGGWYEAPWGVLWAVPVAAVAGWRLLQDRLAEGLAEREAERGLPVGTLEAWLVLLLPHEPERRDRRDAQLDVGVARKHVVWAGDEGWSAALGAVTCLGLPAVEAVEGAGAGDGWLASLAGLGDADRSARMAERLAAVEAG